MLPALLFFLKTMLVIWGLLWFSINFRIVCSISVKNGFGILIETAMKLQITLGCMNILAILMSPTYEHKISFCLFVQSSVTFVNMMSSSFWCRGLSPLGEIYTQLFYSKYLRVTGSSCNLFLSSYHCSQKMFDMISIFFNLLRLVLWSKI